MTTFILTHTHRLFDYADMRPEDVSLVDLIEGAAYTYRFGGMGPIRRCTVLQHSLAASYLCATRGMMAHDLHEVFCADVPAPMKPFVPDYCAFEDKIAAVVRKALGVPQEMTDEERRVDKFLGLFELKWFMGWQEPRLKEWLESTRPDSFYAPLRQQFLDIYEEKDPEKTKADFWLRWGQLCT